MQYRNRPEAGRRLAAALAEFEGRSDVLVLALPRGGVPVAAEVAARLHAPLDLCLVRKLGLPGHEELAMGAIAIGGVQVLNDELIRAARVPLTLVTRVVDDERKELNSRDRAYRGGRPAPDVKGRIVILVDDGLATGATMEAAVMAVRQLSPSKLVVAVPVGAGESVQRLSASADRVVCPETPEPFRAVGLWYQVFDQTSDAEVVRLLKEAETRAAPPKAKAANPGPGAGVVEVVRSHALALSGAPAQYDALLEGIGDARVVLLGEATHGTHEFYRERAFITRRLITEKGFAAVAVEADWPDAYRINRTCAGRVPTRRRCSGAHGLRTLPDVDVAERGRPGFHRLVAHAQRDTVRGQTGRLLRPRPVQPSRVDASRACVSRQGGSRGGGPSAWPVWLL